MEYLPEGYSYEVVTDSDSNCQMIRIKEVQYLLDSAKLRAGVGQPLDRDG